MVTLFCLFVECFVGVGFCVVFLTVDVLFWIALLFIYVVAFDLGDTLYGWDWCWLLFGVFCLFGCF